MKVYERCFIDYKGNLHDILTSKNAQEVKRINEMAVQNAYEIWDKGGYSGGFQIFVGIHISNYWSNLIRNN